MAGNNDLLASEPKLYEFSDVVKSLMDEAL